MRSPASPIPDTPLATDSPAKRKRSLSDPTVTLTPFAPRLRTDIIPVDSIHHEDDRLLGARSPRSVLAHRLSDLRIHGPASAVRFDGSVAANVAEDGQRRKRVRMAEQDHSVAEDEEQDEKACANASVNGEVDDSVAIAAPKPQPRQRRLMRPPPRSTSTPEPDPQDLSRRAVPPGTSKRQTEPARQPPALAVPAPPTSPERSDSLINLAPSPITTTTNSARTGPTTSATPPAQHPKQPPKRPATAEDANHEATAAHPADALDPDDDGTGINGIGFRPTPAEAWARAQRRKKQLSDWRAREEREARERRSANRRNRGAAAPPVHHHRHQQQQQQHQHQHQKPAGEATAGTAMDSVVAAKPRVRFAS